MDMPSSNTEATLLVERPEESFSSKDSDLASESCSEFDPPSPDSIPGGSNNFGLLEKNRLDNSWPSKSIDLTTDLRITLGDIVKEIFPHFQPVLASTIKEVLSENTSSRCDCMSFIKSSGVTISSRASENFLFRDPYAPPFVQLNYDEEAEMKKILDNPWIPDETIDRVVVPSTNPNQISQVQHHSLVQENTTTKLQKLIRIFSFSMLCIIIFVIAGVVAFVKLELDFYGSHGGARVREGGIWLRLIRYPQRNQFFLSSNFV